MAYPLTISTKNFIVDDWLGSKYASAQNISVDQQVLHMLQFIRNV